MTTQLPESARKPVETAVKIVLLGDEINRLQARLGGLRRQTGRLTESQPRFTVTTRRGDLG